MYCTYQINYYLNSMLHNLRVKFVKSYIVYSTTLIRDAASTDTVKMTFHLFEKYLYLLTSSFLYYTLSFHSANFVIIKNGLCLTKKFLYQVYFKID